MLTPTEALLRLNSVSSQNRDAVLALVPMLAQGGVDLMDPALIREVWVPLLGELVREGDLEKWDLLGQLGLRQAAWAWLPGDGPREKPAIVALLLQGPAEQRGPKETFWQEALVEGLAQVQVDEDHWSAPEALALLRQVLLLADVGAVSWELATELQARLTLPLNDLWIQERTPLARGLSPKGWDWFVAQGGDPMAPSPSGEPLWMEAAQAVSPGPERAQLSHTSLRRLAPSEAALAWGKAHDPEGHERLVRNDYLKRLEKLSATIDAQWGSDPKTLKERQNQAFAILTQHPQWLTLRHPSGIPAAMIAVKSFPALLGKKELPDAFWSLQCTAPDPAWEPEHRRSWHRDLATGDGWWDLLLFVDLAPTRTIVKQLLAKVPLPSGDRRGWLVRWPNAGSSGYLTDHKVNKGREYEMPTAWHAVMDQRPELFWQGTREEHLELARQWWGQSKTALAHLACRTLPAKDTPTLTVPPLLRGAVMAMRLHQTKGWDRETWVSDWIQGGAALPENLGQQDQHSVGYGLLEDYPDVVAQMRQRHLAQVPPRPSRPRRRA